jgi:hypothetical protein
VYPQIKKEMKQMHFRKGTHTFVVLGILMGSAAIAHAGDACKNVKFKFTNKHDSGGMIELRQVKYFNKANGAWQTEDVKHFECPQGHTCTTTGDNLRDSEGEALTKFRLVYRYKGPKDTDNWSDNVEGGDKEPNDATCNANKTYPGGKDSWTIFGTK